MMELSRDPRFRDDVGGQYASIVAAMPEVRAALLQMQQDFALRPVFADGTPAAGAIYDGRDERDSNRSTAPLKPAADAVILDTSGLTIAAVLETAEKIIDSYQKNS